jgi:hypothetical protein
MQAGSGPAAGPDGVGPAELSKSDVGRLAGTLAGAIQDRSYRPGPRLPVEIHKQHSGGMRTLAIPNFPDRVVARALLDVIHPLLDVLFFETSYGFRPQRGTWQMLATLKSLADYHQKWTIVNSDVRRAFDSVRIDDVLGAFRQLFAQTEVSECGRRTQQRLMRFIRDILQGGDPTRSVGIGTGCPFSPCALNALLHIHHDELFQEERNNPLWIRSCDGFRYADNLVYLVESVSCGQRLLQNVRRRLSLRCKLDIKDDAEVVDLRDGAEKPVVVLGFALRCQNDQLVFEFPTEAIHRFEEHLEEAYEKPQPALAARETARGWVSSMGPAMECGRDLLPHIAVTLSAHGFRDSCTLAELDLWWATSCRRWRQLLQEVRMRKGLLICNWHP